MSRIWYHASPSWRSILIRGLRPRTTSRGLSRLGESGRGRIYLFKRKEDAYSYIDDITTRESTEHPIDWGILEVNLPSAYKLKHDPEYESSYPPITARYSTTAIPANRIRLIERYNTANELQAYFDNPLPYILTQREWMLLPYMEGEARSETLIYLKGKLVELEKDPRFSRQIVKILQEKIVELEEG